MLLSVLFEATLSIRLTLPNVDYKDLLFSEFIKIAPASYYIYIEYFSDFFYRIQIIYDFTGFI